MLSDSCIRRLRPPHGMPHRIRPLCTHNNRPTRYYRASEIQKSKTRKELALDDGEENDDDEEEESQIKENTVRLVRVTVRSTDLITCRRHWQLINTSNNKVSSVMGRDDSWPGVQCGAIITLQFSGESDPETPKMAKPYFRSRN